MRDDTDDSDDDERPRRPRRSTSTGSVLSSLRIAESVAWGVLLMVTALGGVTFVLMIMGSKSAPQEAAVGAMFSTAFIGSYVGMRCIEKMIAGYERTHAKESSNGR